MPIKHTDFLINYDILINKDTIFALYKKEMRQNLLKIRRISQITFKILYLWYFL